MSQKFTKLQNNNKKSTAYGKWFATAVYDQRFVETEELANYIQQQASVNDELGGAMKHYFELGQKVKLDGIGIFKVGFSSIGTSDKLGCTAATITTRRVLFQPETVRIVVGQSVNKEGKIVQKYVVAKALIKDVLFEETYDPSLKPEGNADSSDDSGSSTGSETVGGGSSTGSETAGGGSSTGSETAGGDPQNPGGGDDGLDQD